MTAEKIKWTDRFALKTEGFFYFVEHNTTDNLARTTARAYSSYNALENAVFCAQTAKWTEWKTPPIKVPPIHRRKQRKDREE